MSGSTDGPERLELTILDRQRRRRIDGRRFERLLQAAAARLEVSGALTLVFGSDRLLRPLNQRFRGKDRATDVLSFPGPGGDMGLGDVVISVESAERNAPRFGRTAQQELEILALHGFLHVLGYDHETDDGTMDRLEGRLRRSLLPRPAARRPRASA